MKTWKLVSGILSIVLSVFVLFQSALAGVANKMEKQEEVLDYLSQFFYLLVVLFLSV